jgi:hypothetical protein
MKVGDLAMFIDEGRYAKWFYGRLGIVENTTAPPNSSQRGSCRIRWLEPVRYFDGYATVSDFGWDMFEIYNETR